MKHAVIRWFFKCCWIFFSLSPLFAGEPTPHWTVGDWFFANQRIAGIFSLDSGELPITLNTVISLHGQWLVTDIGDRFLPQCETSAAVYVVSSETLALEGSGHIVCSDPIVLDCDVRLSEASAAGEIWVRTSDLNPVAFHARASGTIEAFLFNNWTNIGSFSGDDLDLEFCPESEDFQWPISLSMSPWFARYTLFMQANIAVDLSIFGIPYSLFSPFSGSTEFNYEVACTAEQIINGCNAYAITMIDHVSDGYSEAYYCPPMDWFTRKTVTNFSITDNQGQGTINVDSWQWDFIDYYHQATPTPEISPTPMLTPTASPTCSGIELQLTSDMSYYHSGDWVDIDLVIDNCTGSSFTADTYVLIDVEGIYFCWPSWTELSDLIDMMTYTYPPGITILHIFYFQVPPLEKPIDIWMYAALFQPGTLDISTMIGYCASLHIILGP